MSFHISSHSVVPPGFRFHPTDEELVGYYLQKKVVFKKIDLDVIRDIDLYKLEPWDIQEKCRIGSGEQNEWYFFSHKDKKYPTGTRTNRATTAGFWKATGRDKAIFTKFKLIGMRKTLVFYKGRAPNGQKTDWIMHEYRLEDDINNTTTNEEGWVICRVFKKRSMVKRPSEYGGHGGYNSLIPDLESLDKYINSNIYCNPTFNCKQEVDMNYYNPCQGSFLLPQLESPKSASDPSNALALLFEENNNALSYPSFVKMDNSALQDQPSVQQNQFHEINEGLGTEWSAIDRVVSELNQHEDQKETRFTTGNDSLEDTPVASRFIKGHLPVDYPYCSDIDLWTYAQP